MRTAESTMIETQVQEEKNMNSSKICKLAKFVYKHYWGLMAAIAMFIIPVGFCDPVTAETKWDTVINFMLPWIRRLGGVVILIGAIEFGLGFKNDDADAKTKGLRIMIAGAIVAGVSLASNVFLY